jgi:hypothetical protein
MRDRKALPSCTSTSPGVLYLRNWMMCGCKSAEWFTISLRMLFWLRTTSRRSMNFIATCGGNGK